MPETDSSIASSFQFSSFKIDEFHFSMEKQIPFLGRMQNYDGDDWEINLTIRQPSYFKPGNVYIAGIGCKVILRPNKSENPIATLEAFASGIFSTTGQFPPELEDSLIKYQMPSILFPYLRSAITSFLANSGFGSVILPLINVNKLAHDVLKDAAVQVLGEL